MNQIRYLSLICCYIFLITSLNSQTIYVSPYGDISNEGTLESPLPSFAAAVDKVRQKIPLGKNVTIFFREGSYFFDETVILTNEDSGNENQKIIYKAYPGEKPVFTSGSKIEGWKKINSSDPNYNYLPDEAKNSVFVSHYPKEFGTIRFLNDNNSNWIELGKINVTEFVTTEKYIHGHSVEGQMWDPPDEKKVCEFSKSLENLSNVDSALMFTIYTADFELQILPVKKIDRNVLTTATPGGHRLALPDDGQRHGSNELAFIHNLVEGINAPGKFACYPASGKIYLWPKNGLEEIYIPKLNELIVVEGLPAGKDAWFSTETEKPVTNIIFDGISFTNCRQPLWEEDNMAAQHDWAMLDKDNAMLRFRGAENCIVRNCVFEKSGGAGIAYDLHAMNNLIENCKFQNLGYEGIRLGGYGIGLRDVNKFNIIRNNEIQNVNKIHHYGAAIVLWNTGFNKIVDNFIHHFASRAILFSAPRSRAFTKNNQKHFPSNRAMREQAWPMARWFEIPDHALAKIYYANEEEDGEILNIRRVEVNGYKQGSEGGLIADSICSQFRYLRGNIVERNLIGNGAEELFADGIFYITACAIGEPNKIKNNYIYNTGIDLSLPNIPFRLIYIDGYTGQFEFTQNFVFNSKFRFEVTAMYNWWDEVNNHSNIFYNVAGEEYGKENICIGKGPNNPQKQYLKNYKSMLQLLRGSSFSQIQNLPGKEEIIKELSKVINSY